MCGQRGVGQLGFPGPRCVHSLLSDLDNNNRNDNNKKRSGQARVAWPKLEKVTARLLAL